MPTEQIKCKFCDFMVRTADDDELMNMIETHNNAHHPEKDVPREMVRERIETVK